MITKIPNIVRASELRKNLSRYLKESATKPVVISTNRGGESRVLLGSALYNRLVEALEDLEDTRDIELRVNDDDGKRVSLASLRKKHGV